MPGSGGTENEMERIVFATGNKDKLREIRMILEGIDAEIVSMKDAGFTGDIVEDGDTFEQNAIIKAKAVSQNLNCIAWADDSGLEVDYLDKAPGVLSARFMGEDTSYTIKNRYIIDQLNGIEDERRTARFVCAIACAMPDGRVFTVRGTMEGIIAREPAGENGFGYDPIFFLPEYGCTSAELSPQDKNAISHRGKALLAMKEKFEQIIKEEQ